MDTSGNLYGTTVYGGSSTSRGYGTVFKLDTSGTKTVPYSFAKKAGAPAFAA